MKNVNFTVYFTRRTLFQRLHVWKPEVQFSVQHSFHSQIDEYEIIKKYLRYLGGPGTSEQLVANEKNLVTLATPVVLMSSSGFRDSHEEVGMNEFFFTVNFCMKDTSIT